MFNRISRKVAQDRHERYSSPNKTSIFVMSAVALSALAACGGGGDGDSGSVGPVFTTLNKAQPLVLSHRGYPGMYLLAAIPPLWFRVMDPKVMAWAGGDLSKVNVHQPAIVRLQNSYSLNAKAA